MRNKLICVSLAAFLLLTGCGKPSDTGSGLTTGEPERLTVSADREVVLVDGVAHLDIFTVDKAGRFVPDADLPVRCEILSGPAHLVGMDAGNMFDLSLFSEPVRAMSAGRLMAMIMADAPGVIRVRVSAEGMEPVELELFAQQAERAE